MGERLALKTEPFAAEREWTVEGVPVLFDIRVLPKSMTDGYGAWWRVGDTAVSENQRNLDAYQDHLAHVKDARKY